MTVEELTQKHDHPIIGIIGSTIPTPSYYKRMGRDLGYLLREGLERKNGTLFTGGVAGVGVDFYSGIVEYCMDNQTNNDRFFCLFPDWEYNVDGGYTELSKLIRKEPVVERIGKDFNERREQLGRVGDVFVLLNGGEGSVHEAFCALFYNKPVLCHLESGGGVDLLYKLKKDEIPEPDFSINKELIIPCSNCDEIAKYIKNHYLDNQGEK
jgi:predicted Rossmann-fold nucleotide-binding protein